MADINGTSYAPKLDKTMQEAMNGWFSKLSKAEILQFLMDRDDITADALRDMLKHEQVVLGFGLQYSVAEDKAVADFGANE